MLLETRNFIISPVLALLMIAAFVTLYGGLLLCINTSYLIAACASLTFSALIIGIRL